MPFVSTFQCVAEQSPIIDRRAGDVYVVFTIFSPRCDASAV
jgi:hypothetical protein